MKILGIGNAIVDVICKVENKFLSDNKLTKSTMKLVDEVEFKKLLSSLKIEETVSGGSVANSIVGLSQLGNKVGFIGKINDDKLGSKYEEGLRKENIKYFYSKKKEDSSTGTCLILITPDSERTMCTFLGTAGKINENDVDINAVKNSEITFLEGYLWDEGNPKKAFDKAIQNSNKVAMSLSDLFCVKRHKKHFLDLVKTKLDITFANEQEITTLIDAKKFVDLTGAGDLFAAGFLHGFINNKTMEESIKKGTELSSKIIQQIGARL
jgi:sugar/nucleoside kinase (ribokinase family)